MRKRFFILITLFIANYGFSQEKKLFFYNENVEEITKDEFYKQRNYQKNLDLYFENDTLINCVLIQRKNYGQLSEEDFKKLKNSLSSNTNLDGELIVIVYYPGKDRCNGMERISTWNIFDNDYLRKLRKINSYNHFWIYKNDENLKYYHPRKVKWTKDTDQIVEKLFFKFHYPCFSSVVIDKKGNYISYYGEFGKREIWEMSSELSKK